MKRILQKLLAFFLVIMFTLPTLALANNPYDDLDNSYADQTITSITDFSDVFNVPVTPGEEHDGYIFQLVEGATISLTENEGIQVLFAPKNLFRANTLQDIIDFVAPELIMYIEPNYIISLGPIIVSEP